MRRASVPHPASPRVRDAITELRIDYPSSRQGMRGMDIHATSDTELGLGWNKVDRAVHRREHAIAHREAKEQRMKDDPTHISINWSGQDGTAESTCTCRCVFDKLKDGDDIPTFRSHVKFAAGALYARKPCPDCGRHDRLQSARGDPEPL